MVKPLAMVIAALAVVCQAPILPAQQRPEGGTPAAATREGTARAGSPSVYEAASAIIPETQIDALVSAKLKALQIEPASICSDAVFVRRAYLDVIGTVPTAREAADFIRDARPEKRKLLVDRLLEREEFADYVAMRWSDLLRVKAEFPINLWPNAVQAYHRWIHASVRENKPYDVFARELLTSSGSNFRVGPANFYRAMQSREAAGVAQTVALTFMASRTDHWPRERVAGMSPFFSSIAYKSTGEWKEEIVYFDPGKLRGAPVVAAFPDGTTVRLTAERDPREVFADWLVSPRNPHFSRAIANRVWFWLQGRGIVHEPDDMRPDNPPANPELLAYLEKELVASKYDLKHLYRLILNSRTYQRSSVPRSAHAQAEAQLAHYPLRRMQAEVLIDAICQITGSTEKYSSPIPEPFTFVPPQVRSIQLADASISSSFLELFGRSPRDSGLELERNTRPSAAQRVHMLNSTHIQRKIVNSRKVAELQRLRTPRDMIEDLYLTVLSRYPGEDEAAIALGYFDTRKRATRDAIVDLFWALVNSDEFGYRH